MKCKYCDKITPDSSKYCRHCGNLVQRNKLSNHAYQSSEAFIASQNKRFLNYLIDTLGYYLWAYPFGFILGYTWGITGMESVYSISNMNDFLLGWIVAFFYFFILEAATGKTIGKLITGTRVVQVNGDSATVGTIFVRTLCRYIPLNAFSFLGSNRPVGWHDQFSNTRVIDERKARELVNDKHSSTAA